MNDFLLTFEYSFESEMVEIHLDNHGITILHEFLNFIGQKKEAKLSIDANTLSHEKQGPDNKLVSIVYWVYKESYNDRLLTFEFVSKTNELYIHINKSGVSCLRTYLDALYDEEEHHHLMTSDWGGKELSLTKFVDSSELIHHVKIMSWTS
ncbi:MAG: Imm32 family immunity protein [Kiritimatiellae bacterium]|jgi:hypothetical protein|nr:Imm32 family immunity protein [Kiritimatiellia bacterium]